MTRPCEVCEEPVEYNDEGEPISNYWTPGDSLKPFCSAWCSLVDYTEKQT